MASGSEWNLWVRLVGVVVRRYIDFLIIYPYSSCIYLFFFAAVMKALKCKPSAQFD